MSTVSAAPKIRDRVVELRRVPASSLRANASNWRRHPGRQRQVMTTMLKEVGFAGALLARQTEDGTLELIDGHLRADVSDDAQVPVLVVDVDALEAKRLLATFDPIGAMAETDADTLRALLADLGETTPQMIEVMDDVARVTDSILADAPFDATKLPDAEKDGTTKEAFVLYLSFATREALQVAVVTLSGGKRKPLEATDSQARMTGDDFLPMWREKMGA